MKVSAALARYGFLPEEHANVMAAFIDQLAPASFTPVMQDWGGPVGFHLAGRDRSGSSGS